MKILHVFPEYPHTGWSLKQALNFSPRKSLSPPLGFLSATNLLPDSWETRIIDMNVERLLIEDILWADYVFLSATHTQIQSVLYVIDRCKALLTPTVAAGPLFNTDYQKFGKVEHLILKDLQTTLPLFLNDLETGDTKHIYSTNEFANIGEAPLWDYLLARQN